MSSLFAPGSFPEGEILEQPGVFNSYRVTSEEKRAADRAQDDLYDRVRHASEVHRQARGRVALRRPPPTLRNRHPPRQVRRYAQSFIKPGITLTDMCERIENKNRELVEERGLQVQKSARGLGSRRAP